MATRLGYRPDIDGLRAVAVTAVVACHAGWPGATGGFTGVDVFFAISGFLITSLLLREQSRTGRIDLADFWARRIRRIVPPLALVVVTTLVLGFFILLPIGEQQDLAGSAIAAIGFSSNLYFMQANTGYFAAPAQFMVLLHTWSLAIEEQFYLLWPVLIVAAAWLGKRWRLSAVRLLVPLIAAGCALSFVACLVVLEWSQAAAFYFTPLRGWELGLGALLAFAPASTHRPRVGAFLGIAGLGAIIAVAALLRSGHDFALGAAVATAGAAAVIAAGSLAPTGPATRLLATSPLVWVGKLSYGWYLWHWPLLTLGRINSLGAPSLARDTVLAVMAFGLAILTWILVERPSRTRWKMAFTPSRRAFATGAALSLVCALGAGTLWAWGNWQRSNMPLFASVQDAMDHKISFAPACDGTDDRMVEPLPSNCILGATSSSPSVVVWGDSHARHLLPGLAATAAGAGIALAPQHKSGCRPGLTEGRYRRGPAHRIEDRCRQFNRAVLAKITDMRNTSGLTGVILASRWSRDDGWEQDLEQLLRTLRAQGLRVLIVADPPSYPFDVPTCLARRGQAACANGRGVIAAEQAADTAALERIASLVPAVKVWSPAEAMCPDGVCRLMAGNDVLYSDWHHLSPAGSMLVGAYAASPLAWVAGQDQQP